MKVLASLMMLVSLIACTTVLTTSQPSYSASGIKWIMVQSGNLAQQIPEIYINVAGIKEKNSTVTATIKSEFIMPTSLSFGASNTKELRPIPTPVKYLVDEVTFNCKVQTVTMLKETFYSQEHKIILVYAPTVPDVNLMTRGLSLEAAFRVLCRQSVTEKFSI